MIILGIDPGLNCTGFGIIKVVNGNYSYITSGVIKNNTKDDFFNKIGVIFKNLNTVIQKFKPQVAAVEKIFVNINPKSTLLLGQARGAAIAVCTLHNLKLYEYTALQIKQSVTGYGHAHKSQVQKMINTILGIKHQFPQDAADALATAFTHTFFNNTVKNINKI